MARGMRYQMGEALHRDSVAVAHELPDRFGKAGDLPHDGREASLLWTCPATSLRGSRLGFLWPLPAMGLRGERLLRPAPFLLSAITDHRLLAGRTHPRCVNPQSLCTLLWKTPPKFVPGTCQYNQTTVTFPTHRELSVRDFFLVQPFHGRNCYTITVDTGPGSLPASQTSYYT